MTPTNKKAAWYALIVLFLVNTVNFFDRLIIGALGEPIRKEFALSDASLGLLSTAFTLLYAFVGIPFGRMADKYSRKNILSAGVLVWSLLTAASGFARNFWQLFALRLGVGVGEASCAPAATSLIGDMFPAEKRGRAMSIFMLGLPIGIALSFALSGTIAQAYGWRAAFFVAGVPGLLLAAAALFIREPLRGASESSDIGERRRDGSPYRLILASPTIRWLIVSGILHNFALYALSSFMTPYLMRYHGLQIREASIIAMLINGVFTLPGLLLGGFVGDAAKRWRTDGALIVVTFAVLLSAPLFYFGVSVQSGGEVAFLFYMGAAFALMYFYYAIVYSAIQDVTEPSLRGTAMSIYFLAMYLLGGALGPYVVGLMSDYFTRSAASAAGITEFSTTALEPFRAAGLQSAMYVVPALCVVLAGVLYAASRTVKSDTEKIRKWMSSTHHN
jgi:predicted MFS family arabinose efflux permease